MQCLVNEAEATARGVALVAALAEGASAEQQRAAGLQRCRSGRTVSVLVTTETDSLFSRSFIPATMSAGACVRAAPTMPLMVGQFTAPPGLSSRGSGTIAAMAQMVPTCPTRSNWALLLFSYAGVQLQSRVCSNSSLLLLPR